MNLRWKIPIWLACLGLILIPIKIVWLDELITILVFSTLGITAGYELKSQRVRKKGER